MSTISTLEVLRRQSRVKSLPDCTWEWRLRDSSMGSNVYRLSKGMPRAEYGRPMPLFGQPTQISSRGKIYEMSNMWYVEVRAICLKCCLFIPDFWFEVTWTGFSHCWGEFERWIWSQWPKIYWKALQEVQYLRFWLLTSRLRTSESRCLLHLQLQFDVKCKVQYQGKFNQF